MFMPSHPLVKRACDQARLAFDRGEVYEAIHMLDVADAQTDGDKPFLTLHRAEFQLMSGNQNSAVRSMDKALQMAPYNPKAHAYIRALLGKCTPNEATAQLENNVARFEQEAPLVWSRADHKVAQIIPVQA